MAIALDFDGVLADYRGLQGDGAVGAPVAGALEFVQRPLGARYQVVTFTCRDVARVRQWLAGHDFPQLPVTDCRPPALLYMDDRAHCFDGDWESAFAAIDGEPWWSPMAQLTVWAEGEAELRPSAGT